MELINRAFDELTPGELYEILRVRSAVFVVEQNCAYLDPDGLDQKARHLFLKNEKGEILAYLRIFRPENAPDTLQIGRVLTVRRGEGLGAYILHEAVEAIRRTDKAAHLRLEAQSYATGFYTREGFRIASEEFLEDGIPHVLMVLDL